MQYFGKDLQGQNVDGRLLVVKYCAPARYPDPEVLRQVRTVVDISVRTANVRRAIVRAPAMIIPDGSSLHRNSGSRPAPRQELPVVQPTDTG